LGADFGTQLRVNYIPTSDYTLTLTNSSTTTTYAANTIQLTVVLANEAAFKAVIEPQVSISKSILQLAQSLSKLITPNSNSNSNSVDSGTEEEEG